MPHASEIRPGQIVHLEGQKHRVVAVDSHLGGGKMGSLIKMRIESLETGTTSDRRFRPEDKIETVELEKRHLGYLYSDGDMLYFMDPSTYEQYPVPAKLLGKYVEFIKDGEELTVQFLGRIPVHAAIPQTVELKVTSTSPPEHGQETSVWKEAVLENGSTIQVPLFIATGDRVILDLGTGKYRDRAK